MLLGLAGALAGAGMLAPATAQAVPPVGGGPGGLALTPSRGSIADQPVANYRTAFACPAHYRGTGRIFLFDATNRPVGALSESIASTASRPSGKLDVNSLGAVLGARPTGDYQVGLGCFDATLTKIVIADNAWVHVDKAAGTWQVVHGPAQPAAGSPGPGRPHSSPKSPLAASPGAARATPVTTDAVNPSVQADETFTFTVSTEPVIMSDATLDGTRLTSRGSLSPVTVTDARDTGKPGWTVSAQITDFTGSSSTLDGSALGWTPSIISGGNGVTLGAAVPAGTTPGLTQSARLGAAAAGEGIGTTQLGATLTMQAPVGTPAGNYRATLTLTVVESAG